MNGVLVGIPVPVIAAAATAGLTPLSQARPERITRSRWQ